MQMPPPSWPQDECPQCEDALEPVSRKRSLKMHSKGELIRYVLELEARIDRAQHKRTDP